MLAIGVGGVIGAILRAYLSGMVNENFTHTLPLGTLAVNLLGSFVLGSLFAYFTYTTFFSPNLKALLSTGMMGALTTYSTFAMETFFLINGGAYLMAIGNMALNLFGSIVMAGIGYRVFEFILK